MRKHRCLLIRAKAATHQNWTDDFFDVLLHAAGRII